MSDCNCNTINTTPCTSGPGCQDTNYAKCIYYSGDDIESCVTITYGDNLDVVIAALVAAICDVTPDDLAWNTFDYGCLGPFTTAQGFAEGVSEAHCSLVDRVEDLEAPVFTRCSLFTSGPYLITPGTTTLQTVLEYYGDILCTLSENDPATISVANGCFTDNTGIETLEGFLTWIVENTCSIRSTINANVASVQGEVDNIQDYLGTPSQLATLHDLTCLSGGSTETAYDAIEQLVAGLCTTNTTLAAVPDLSAVTLSWGPCYLYGATASLSTQLGRIVSVLKAQKYTFSSDFTVTPGSCGDAIALAASVGAFSCSDLESCSIQNLGDVDDTALTSADLGKKLTYFYNGVNYIFKPVVDSTFTNVGIQATTGLYAAEPNGFYFKNQVTPLDGSSKNYQIGFVEDAWLSLTPYFDADYTQAVAIYDPYIKKTWDGHIQFKGAVSSVGTPAVGNQAQPMSNGSYSTVFTGIPAAYCPTITSFIDIIIEYPHTSDGNLSAFVAGKMQITTTGTVSIRCYDVDVAAAIGTDYDGDFNFMLFDKVIHQ